MLKRLRIKTRRWREAHRIMGRVFIGGYDQYFYITPWWGYKVWNDLMGEFFIERVGWPRKVRIVGRVRRMIKHFSPKEEIIF